MKFEIDLIKFLQTNATTGWIGFFQVITLLGSFLGLVISFLLIFVRNKKLAFVLLITFAIASVFNHILKAIIGRARPFDATDEILNYGNEDGFSMPSGHSLCGGLFATFLIYHLFSTCKNKWTRALGTMAYGSIAILIGFSRMVLGVHYLTDVIAGIIVGIIFAIAGIMLYNVIRKIWDNLSQKIE